MATHRPTFHLKKQYNELVDLLSMLVDPILTKSQLVNLATEIGLRTLREKYGHIIEQISAAQVREETIEEETTPPTIKPKRNRKTNKANK